MSACNFHARQEARRQEHAQRCSTPIDVHDGIYGLSNNGKNASIGTDKSAPLDARAAPKVAHGTRSDATGCSADRPSKYVMTVPWVLNTILARHLMTRFDRWYMFEQICPDSECVARRHRYKLTETPRDKLWDGTAFRNELGESCRGSITASSVARQPRLISTGRETGCWR